MNWMQPLMTASLYSLVWQYATRLTSPCQAYPVCPMLQPLLLFVVLDQHFAVLFSLDFSYPALIQQLYVDMPYCNFFPKLRQGPGYHTFCVEICKLINVVFYFLIFHIMGQNLKVTWLDEVLLKQWNLNLIWTVVSDKCPILSIMCWQP